MVGVALRVATIPSVVLVRRTFVRSVISAAISSVVVISVARIYVARIYVARIYVARIYVARIANVIKSTFADILVPPVSLDFM